MLEDLRETLRFCELVAMNKHPGGETVIAYLRLHPLGWEVCVEVVDEAASYGLVDADPLRGARELARLIGEDAPECEKCYLLQCICERLSGRSTVDERP